MCCGFRGFKIYVEPRTLERWNPLRQTLSTAITFIASLTRSRRAEISQTRDLTTQSLRHEMCLVRNNPRHSLIVKVTLFEDESRGFGYQPFVYKMSRVDVSLFRGSIQQRLLRSIAYVLACPSQHLVITACIWTSKTTSLQGIIIYDQVSRSCVYSKQRSSYQ